YWFCRSPAALGAIVTADYREVP
ncbi:MAG: hypothetical protein QOF44_4493, partial [Streptomyces sp.]|nr:hypothetical protein [Streptomyces sp.]